MRTGSFSKSGDPDTVVYDGFRSSVQINAPGGSQYATARMSIKGLSQDVMNRLTLINYVNIELQRNEVLVEATGPDGEFNTLFRGTIGSAMADYNGAPDVAFVVEAYQSLFEATSTTAPTSWPGAQSVAAIATALAKGIGYPLENNGVTSSVTDAYLSGSPVDQIRRLCDMARCQMWIEAAEGVIAIAPLGQPRKTDALTISASTGMVGWPTPTHLGVDFVCLYDPAIYRGRELNIDTTVTPCAGKFFVRSVTISLDCETPGGAWFMYVNANAISQFVRTR
jgi:hypothetical protein